MIGKLTYKLGAGGRDPHAPTPGKGPNLECDCAGFVCWALGFDRRQPKFYADWGWVNTDSMIAEARGACRYFKEVPEPSKGILVVYPSLYEGGRRKRIGHVGMATSNPDWAVPKGVAGISSGTRWGALRVTHCSAGNQRRFGHAVMETPGMIWQNKGTVFLEYQGGLGPEDS